MSSPPGAATDGGLVCTLCSTVVPPKAPGLSSAASDVCPGCRLRIRHRALGAYFGLIGNPTASGRCLVCHANSEERQYLFPDARNLLNFDIRPLPFTDTVMDIQRMASVETGSVDVFVALHILQHVADDTSALAEIARVLKPDSGMFLFTVPFRRGTQTESISDITSPYGKEALAQYGVGTFRRYGLGDLRRLLERWFAVMEFGFSDSLVGEAETVFHARPLRVTDRSVTIEANP